MKMTKKELTDIQELIDIMERNGPGFSRAIPAESHTLIIAALQSFLLIGQTLQMESDLPKVIINEVQFLFCRVRE